MILIFNNNILLVKIGAQAPTGPKRRRNEKQWVRNTRFEWKKAQDWIAKPHYSRRRGN